jgi:AcrR family transcriptional regulator
MFRHRAAIRANRSRTIVLVECVMAANPSGSGPGTFSRSASREGLLQTIGEVFEAQGYDGATLALLSAATGLGKASLYHHFPGGKADMAAALLRDRVARLERLAFSRLQGSLPPTVRLTEFIDGFREYVEDGQRNCLLLVFREGTAGAQHGATIASQIADWQRRLAAAYEESGQKPKRSERSATELLASLYGALVTARLTGDPASFKRQAKRLKKALPA